VRDSWMEMDQQKHTQMGTDPLGCKQRVLIKGCSIGGFCCKPQRLPGPTWLHSGESGYVTHGWIWINRSTPGRGRIR
jgi:hypothetical protein